MQSPLKQIFSKLYKDKCHYAALGYVGDCNIGDDIQSLAAMQFLPEINKFAERERLDEFEDETKHKIILNGWFLHRPDHWPPSPKINALVTSFHATRELGSDATGNPMQPASGIFSKKGLEFLDRSDLIGTRDLDTLKQMQEHGIKSHFSGCLTLTLQAPGEINRKNIVYAVDIDEDVKAFLERKYKRTIISISHLRTGNSVEERLAIARSILQLYAEARAVITSRLHCALPCLAMSTPVLFVENAPDAYRFDGLRDLVHRSSREEILAGRCSFDPNSPPENGTDWHDLRDGLIMRCEEFIGQKINRRMIADGNLLLPRNDLNWTKNLNSRPI